MLTVAFFSGAVLGVWVCGGICGSHINPAVLLHLLNPVQTYLTSAL
jgi:glycerol uptake facilitator-like aquaporin